MTEAKYKLMVEVSADKIVDLEQLLCAVAESVLDGMVAGIGGGRIGSYTFNLEEPGELEAQKGG